MEPDIQHFVPQGTIPTEGEFVKYLCDRTFVDYFNVFLSLPVFAQRLIYRYSLQSFELDPPLKRSQYDLDKVWLMAWVRTQRAPLFFKTDLFNEFLLCKYLQKTVLRLSASSHDICYSAVKSKRDEHLMLKCIGKVSGMRKFRNFLSTTAGANSFKFWLDAEQFRRLPISDTEKHRELFRQIQSKYFKNGAALELPENAKWVAFSDNSDTTRSMSFDGGSSRFPSPDFKCRGKRGSIVGSGVEFSGRLRSGSIYGDHNVSIFANNVFVAMQNFVLKTLRTYWLPRYVIHCKVTWHKRDCNFDLSIQPPVQSDFEQAVMDIVDDMGDAGKKARQQFLDKQKFSHLMSMFRSTEIRGPLELIEEDDEFQLSDDSSSSSSEEDIVDEFSDGEKNQGGEKETESTGRKSTGRKSRGAEFALPTLEEGEEEEEVEEIAVSSPEDSPQPKEQPIVADKSNVAEAEAKNKDAKNNVLDKYKRRNSKLGSFHSTGSSKDSLLSLGGTDTNSYYMMSISGKIRRKTAANPTKKRRKHIPGEKSNQMSYVFDFETMTLMRRDEFDKLKKERKQRDKERKKEEKRLAAIEAAALTAMSKSKKGKQQVMSGSKGSIKDGGKGKRGSLPPIANRGRRDTVFAHRAPTVELLKAHGKKRKGSLKTPLPSNNKQKRNSITGSTSGKSSPGLKLSKDTMGILNHVTLSNTSQRLSSKSRSQDSPTSRNKKEGEKEHERTFDEQTHDDDELLLHLPDICLSEEIITRGIREGDGDFRRPNSRGRRSSSAQSEHQSYDLFPRLSEEKLHTAAPVSKLCDGFIDFHLGETNYKYTHIGLVNAIAADRLAGMPFRTYLQKHRQVKMINYLTFWNKSQEYLATEYYHSDTTDRSIKYRCAKEIISMHLVKGGKSSVNIGEQLANKLVELLPEGLGNQLLMHAQELACEALKDSWMIFQKCDEERFLRHTTRRKKVPEHEATKEDIGRVRGTGFPDGLPQISKPVHTKNKKGAAVLPSARTQRERFDEYHDDKETRPHTEQAPPNVIAPHRMARALKLAGGISQLGIEKDEISDLSDIDDEDDEGSLKRREQVVIRRRKPVEIIRMTPRVASRSAGTASGLLSGMSRHSVMSMSEIQIRDRASGDQPFLLKSIQKNGRTIKRPPRPRNFYEVLRASDHLEYFKQFLMKEKSETPLLFWQAVETMKQCKDAKTRSKKATAIARKFFSKATGSGAALECRAEVIGEIPKMTNVTPPMLLSAQACIVKSMDEQWFQRYFDTFPSDGIEQDARHQEVSAAPDKKFCREKTKAFWAMFIQNVISFRRGLMTPATLNLFKQFLKDEIAADLEKQRITGNTSRKVISHKIISVERLESDLAFWAEVERFKECVDEVARAALTGTYSPDDEILVHMKAQAIVDCFIESQLPPKLQINVSQDTADAILDAYHNGVIERGLFHDAAVSIFTVLLHFWKKFCRERFKPKHSESRNTIVPHVPPKRVSKKQPNYLEINKKKLYKMVAGAIDDDPMISFSFSHGLRLILPPQIPKDLRVDEKRPMFLYNYNQHGRQYSKFVDDKGCRFSRLADLRKLKLPGTGDFGESSSSLPWLPASPGGRGRISSRNASRNTATSSSTEESI
ncbi:uncharacterized protein LOC100376370 [Saccoglossus kowalevskii]